MSFVERFIILCPYLGGSTIEGSTVCIIEVLETDYSLLNYWRHGVCYTLTVCIQTVFVWSNSKGRISCLCCCSRRVWGSVWNHVNYFVCQFWLKVVPSALGMCTAVRYLLVLREPYGAILEEACFPQPFTFCTWKEWVLLSNVNMAAAMGGLLLHCLRQLCML